MKPDLSRKPNQHEEQEKLLRKLHQGQEKLIREISSLHTVHEVRFSIPHLDEVLVAVQEVLVVVKDIQERLVGGGGISEPQEQALAGQLHTGAEALQGAVDANRNPTEVP